MDETRKKLTDEIARLKAERPALLRVSPALVRALAKMSLRSRRPAETQAAYVLSGQAATEAAAWANYDAARDPNAMQ